MRATAPAHSNPDCEGAVFLAFETLIKRKLPRVRRETRWVVDSPSQSIAPRRTPDVQPAPATHPQRRGTGCSAVIHHREGPDRPFAKAGSSGTSGRSRKLAITRRRVPLLSVGARP